MNGAQIVSLEQAAEEPLARVGGKAASLGRLIKYGAPVPPGFVVPPQATLDEAVIKAFDELDTTYVAVRSSAAGEDGQGQSWAGQFESYLYVKREQLRERIKACRDSGNSARAQAYDTAHHGMPVAVIVQVMVPSDVAGVLFTANPVTRNRDELVLEAVYGLGELLVGGIATPDNYRLAKPSGEIIEATPALQTVMLVGSDAGVEERPVPTRLQGQPTMSPDQCRQIAQLAVRLERAFTVPLDIEFAYYEEKLFIVQARPITTI